MLTRSRPWGINACAAIVAGETLAAYLHCMLQRRCGLCVPVRVCVCVWPPPRACACVGAFVRARVHACVRACVRACMCCACVRARACVCVFAWLLQLSRTAIAALLEMELNMAMGEPYLDPS